MSSEESQRRGRGKGVKPAMEHVNLRMPEDVMDFYRRYPRYTNKMREVLIQWVREHPAADPSIRQRHAP